MRPAPRTQQPASAPLRQLGTRGSSLATLRFSASPCRKQLKLPKAAAAYSAPEAASLLPLPEAQGGVPGRLRRRARGPGGGGTCWALAGSAVCTRPLRLQAAGLLPAAAVAAAAAAPCPSQPLPGTVNGDTVHHLPLSHRLAQDPRGLGWLRALAGSAEAGLGLGRLPPPPKGCWWLAGLVAGVDRRSPAVPSQEVAVLTAMAHSPVQSGLPGMQVGRSWAAEGWEGGMHRPGRKRGTWCKHAPPPLRCPSRGRAGLAPLSQSPRASLRCAATGPWAWGWGQQAPDAAAWRRRLLA